jgi:uncharacterized membrane protein
MVDLCVLEHLFHFLQAETAAEAAVTVNDKHHLVHGGFVDLCIFQHLLHWAHALPASSNGQQEQQ